MAVVGAGQTAQSIVLHHLRRYTTQHAVDTHCCIVCFQGRGQSKVAVQDSVKLNYSENPLLSKVFSIYLNNKPLKMLLNCYNFMFPSTKYSLFLAG